jgi:hypothetical protein
MEEDRKMSRREFLYGSTGFAAGAAVASGGLGLLSGCIGQETKVVQTECPTTKAEWPGEYKKLDTARVAEIAYENWYKKFCCYAVASGILVPLQEDVGEPYTSFPIDSVKWGHGGAVGWGTLCGSLTGAGIATGLIAGEEGEAILNDVIYWYTTTELPIYMPDSPKAEIQNVNRSRSPLCHISVGKWMKKEDVAFFSPERKERCARLSADVAVKTVELLNAWADGTYKPDHGSQVGKYDITSQDNCVECHGSEIPDVPGAQA